MKTLFLVTSLLESIAGISLIAAPSFVSSLLLGVPIEFPGSRVVAGIGGAGLLSIGLVCWLARDEGLSRAGSAILSAVTFYNIAAMAILVHAWFGSQLGGLVLWLAVILHAALFVWCIMARRDKGNITHLRQTYTIS